jgi:hypothetical protein
MYFRLALFLVFAEIEGFKYVTFASTILILAPPCQSTTRIKLRNKGRKLQGCTLKLNFSALQIVNNPSQFYDPQNTPDDTLQRQMSHFQFSLHNVNQRN